jgi:shikimate dehydrogenase
MTRRAGIIGWPVGHSLSPILHGHWLKEYGIDGEYLRLPAEPKDFAAMVERAGREGFAGLNVTVPHKEAAFALADIRDAAATAAGAVNLLIFRPDGKIEGRNTDSVGLAESLRENLGDLTGKTVVLLGAGGAARGAVLALEANGASRIHILNRDAGRAERLAGSLAPMMKAILVPGALESWNDVAPNADLLANTTSAGMTGNPSLSLDLAPLRKNAAVLDIVYNPLETELLKDAAARGHQTIDGLGMLMLQAAPSFEAFFSVRPKVTPALRAALVQALHAG